MAQPLVEKYLSLVLSEAVGAASRREVFVIGKELIFITPNSCTDAINRVSSYRRFHQIITAIANPIKGKTNRDDNIKRLACVVVRVIRRFFGSLGRMERGC